MKQRLFSMMATALILMMATALILHCNEDESQDPPQITVDLSPVWAGVRSIDPDADAKQFNLHIRNEGGQTLEITSTKLKGDQNCAFSKEGPDKTELGENGSAFIRIGYKPTVRAEDSVSLIINSNSEKYKKFIIPICGIGVLPEELPDETDTETDTESADDSYDRTCDAPPDDQPDCEDADTEGE